MDKNQLLIGIGLSSLLLLLLFGFLLFMLLWQRSKNNRFVMEKEVMESKFNEQLLKAQLEMQEQTFDFISMEIHDNVGQTLSLLNVQVNIVEQKEIYDPSLISDIKANVGKAMTDLRDIAKSLSSERIRLSSLPELTAFELNRIGQTGTLIVEQSVTGSEKSLKDEQKLILFRMIQEAIQNVTKHAQATNLKINYNYQETNASVTIVDDGIGFEQDGYELGLGLKNIKNRAGVIGSEATISSMPGSGTRITITIAYE